MDCNSATGLAVFCVFTAQHTGNESISRNSYYIIYRNRHVWHHPAAQQSHLTVAGNTAHGKGVAMVEHCMCFFATEVLQAPMAPTECTRYFVSSPM